MTVIINFRLQKKKVSDLTVSALIEIHHNTDKGVFKSIFGREI